VSESRIENFHLKTLIVNHRCSFAQPADWQDLMMAHRQFDESAVDR
jgi:hypothetical protein